MTGKTPEEIIALAGERGRELTEEEFGEISGDEWSDDAECPKCGSNNTVDFGDGHLQCKNCRYKWWW